MKKLTSRKPEFLGSSWPPEFQPHFVVMHCLSRWGWHGECETKQELPQLRMLLQEDERLRLELETTLAFVKDSEDHHLLSSRMRWIQGRT
jgi:hypothetical protein